jgi:hypothetical protein
MEEVIFFRDPEFVGKNSKFQNFVESEVPSLARQRSIFSHHKYLLLNFEATNCCKFTQINA